MYKKHFGLERRIFRGNAAGADVFVGPQTARIVGGVKKALSGMDAVVSITGPVGCGKSTAVAHSLSAISGKNAIVRVGRFPMQRGELLDLLFDHMRIQNRPARGNQKLALFRQLLFNLAQNDSRMFILVEDAPFLGPDMLAELEVLTAADTGPSDGANIVLMGDDYLKELLASKTLARLRQRIRLRRALEPFSAEELGGYLRHCFRRAGGDFDRMFAPGAAELLHELCGGILRVANNLVESALEAAADLDSESVDLDLIARVANEEFGLTGTFTTPPQIINSRPDPKHTDDATAELVALSLPESARAAPRPADRPLQPQPANAPVSTSEVAKHGIESPPAGKSADHADEIPELIQDTQPALAILSDPAPPEPESVPELIQDTLPDLEVLSRQLAQAASSPAPAEQPQRRMPSRPERPGPAARPRDTAAPVAPRERTTQAVPEPAPGPESSALSGAEIPTLELAPELPPVSPPEKAAPARAERPVYTDAVEDDRPDWDRDPTLAELRPDLEALERAMAVAHGRDPDAPEVEPPVLKPEKDEKSDALEGVPEITLDDSINRKVDRAEIERRRRREEETGVAEEEPVADAGNASDADNQENADAELEKIAEGLAQAKTIEDVDDKMAETLFGEELSVAAAAVVARVAQEKAAAEAARAKRKEPKTELEKEFENVWGETPATEVSIESQFDAQKGGLDVSASQRLATVRALSADQKSSNPAAQNGRSGTPAPKPDPIEEQITTSMTQTMKALNVQPAPKAVNDDDGDDDDDGKRGFFSRFRRS